MLKVHPTWPGIPSRRGGVDHWIKGPLDRAGLCGRSHSVFHWSRWRGRLSGGLVMSPWD